MSKHRIASRVSLWAVFGACVLVTALFVSGSEGGSSQSRPSAAEAVPAEAPAHAHAAQWTPPKPTDVPLDCANGTQGMQFSSSPDPSTEPVLVPAPDPDAPAPTEGATASPEPGVQLDFPNPEALAAALTNQAPLGWPGEVAGLLQYVVADQQGDEATILGMFGGERLVLVPAIRRADGSWRWHHARPVREPHGVWVMLGTSITCDDVREPA